MKKILLICFLSISTLLTSYFTLHNSISADELEDISKQIADLAKAREMSISATAPLESQLGQLNKRLASIQSQINQVADKISGKEAELAKLEADIVQSEKDLAVGKFILAKTVRAQYIRLRTNFPLAILLSSQTAQDLGRQLGYNLILAKLDREVIAAISAEILPA